MPTTWDELFELLIELCKIVELKATAYISGQAGLWTSLATDLIVALKATADSSVKAGLSTGFATALGGLLLGKHGLLLGAAIGAGSSAILSNEITPVWMILRDLSRGKKQQLFNKLVNAFKNVGIEDLVTIAILLLRDGSLIGIAIRVISSYLRREMNLKLV